jgi:hypothetical protein
MTMRCEMTDDCTEAVSYIEGGEYESAEHFAALLGLNEEVAL